MPSSIYRSPYVYHLLHMYDTDPGNLKLSYRTLNVPHLSYTSKEPRICSRTHFFASLSTHLPRPQVLDICINTTTPISQLTPSNFELMALKINVFQVSHHLLLPFKNTCELEPSYIYFTHTFLSHLFQKSSSTHTLSLTLHLHLRYITTGTHH